MASLHQTLISQPGNVDIIHGTCEVTDAFGIVRSCRVSDQCDEQVFLDCRGNPREVLLKNERIELTMTVEFDGDLGAPARGDDIAFPDPYSVTGQITGIELIWEQNDRKLMEITAKHWQAMGSTPTVTVLDDA
ncbi:hypothetical protein AYO49_05630 [Verrucomicrobiaceae bacterium SCGC AG-212-N21]|nr:hypothetical protein AYO49_05630 [Verrucomicrobiaceae bacterium SCGC AG-212-N21]